MRILQICSAQTLGGGEVHVIQLADELRKRGHQVDVAGRRGGPVSPDHELAFRNSLDVPTALGLRGIIRRNRFDIVHAHVARDYTVTAAALLGRPGPRLIFTRQLIHQIRPNPAYRRVDGWIATTEQIAGTLRRHRPKQLRIIPNWVDTDRFTYRERPLQDPCVIGLLGQISPHKGHDDALAMIERLKTCCRLLIGGTGDAIYQAGLEARAADLPVEFLGFVRPEEFFQRVDILVLPSWEEPFGIVVLEAMAAGVNVVATAAGGPPHILDDGRAGILVPPHDPGAMAEGVMRVVSNPKLRRTLRRHARERAETTYALPRLVGRTEQFYEDLRARRR